MVLIAPYKKVYPFNSFLISPRNSKKSCRDASNKFYNICFRGEIITFFSVDKHALS